MDTDRCRRWRDSAGVVYVWSMRSPSLVARLCAEVEKMAIWREFGDGPYRDRTCDLGIKSPLLYQLS